MNIEDVKAAIAKQNGITLSSLTLVRQKEGDTKTEWLAHWDNDSRVRVVLHEDVLAQIVGDKSFSGLGLKKEARQSAADKPYTQYVIITPKDIEATI